MSVCPVCGKEFVPSRSFVFCSVQCYKKHWHNEKTKNVRKVCQICGKEFRPGKYSHAYCSPECKKEGRRRHRKVYRKKEYNRPGHQTVVYDRVCAHCGKPFTTKLSNQNFCCTKCQKTYNNLKRNSKRAASVVILTKTCRWCGKEFTTTRNNRMSCSVECSYTFNKHQCSRSEYEARVEKKREDAIRKAAEKKMKVRVNGLTEKQMQAVIDAQNGDPDLLWKRSQSWTPEQHKYAKSRYESMHGLWTQTFYGLDG